MIKAIDHSIPLPFKRLNNKRSYIYIENLINAILFLIKKDVYDGKTFYLSDSQYISTNELSILIAKYLEKKARLFFMPLNIIKFLLIIFGRTDLYNKTMEDFIIDSNQFEKDTGWIPPYKLSEGIKKTCHWYKRRFKMKIGV